MIKDIIEAEAKRLQYVFDYGRHDYLNLNTIQQSNSDRIHFLMYPIRHRENFSRSGFIRNKEYTIEFFLCRKSELNEDYDINRDGGTANNARFEKYIRPLYNAFENGIKRFFICHPDLRIINCNIDEVINVFDMNVDGLQIRLTVNEDF